MRRWTEEAAAQGTPRCSLGMIPTTSRRLSRKPAGKGGLADLVDFDMHSSIELWLERERWRLAHALSGSEGLGARISQGVATTDDEAWFAREHAALIVQRAAAAAVAATNAGGGALASMSPARKKRRGRRGAARGGAVREM